MKIVKYDTKRQSIVLTAMIMNSKVLGAIAGKWGKEGMFPTPWESLIGGWCVKYYLKYGKAPKEQIEHIFRSWAEGQRDPDTVDLVNMFLAALSDKYPRLRKKYRATRYLINMAQDYFKEATLTTLIEKMKVDIDNKKADEALQRLNKYHQPQISGATGITLFHDTDAVRIAFETRRESIIQYPGALGQFFGRELEKGGFIAFMGAEKAGKTFWLADLAYMGVTQRKRIAFFQVGDLTVNQMIQRFAVRVAGRPIYPTRKDEPIRIPKSLEVVSDVAKVDQITEKHYKDAMSWQEAWAAFQKVQKEQIRSKHSYFKLSVHPAKSVSVAEIRGIIDGWDREGWGPVDVVVIDYADILAGPVGFQGDSRDSVNETWIALRKMSQELDCLVVTATQAKATSYNADMLTMEHFSEDKRKFAHVTGMIGINRKAEDKPQGIQRLNWLVLREGDFSVRRYVAVAGCLGIGRPAILSRWPK